MGQKHSNLSPRELLGNHSLIWEFACLPVQLLWGLREDLSGLAFAGIRQDLLSSSSSHGSHQRSRSELSFNETDPAAASEFPLVIPLLGGGGGGGVSDKCAEQSAAFARKLAEREGWALQSERAGRAEAAMNIQSVCTVL